jgi:hypothetical protein
MPAPPPTNRGLRFPPEPRPKYENKSFQASRRPTGTTGNDKAPIPSACLWWTSLFRVRSFEGGR